VDPKIARIVLFQFLIGRLKTKEEVVLGGFSEVFQFLIGRLKTVAREMGLSVEDVSFNSL